MSKNWISLLALTSLALSSAAQAMTISVRVVDAQTDQPISNARVIVNHGAIAEPSNFEMVQENRQFQPGSLLIPKGSLVNFPNRDTTQHHVYSFSPAKVFNIELFADQPAAPIEFDRTGVVEVGCNIHDQMQGFILVTESALTARTDASGMASIPLPANTGNLPELSISLWHQQLVNATETVDFTINIPASDPLELALEMKPEQKEAGRLDGLQKRFRDL